MSDAQKDLQVFVRTGQSLEPVLKLVGGEPQPPLSVGTQGSWIVQADGVLPIHGYLFFDGNTLFASSANPASPLTVRGATIGSAWQPVEPENEIQLGTAVLRVELLRERLELSDDNDEEDPESLPTVILTNSSHVQTATDQARQFRGNVHGNAGGSAGFGATAQSVYHHASAGMSAPATAMTGATERYPNHPTAPVRPGTVVAPRAVPPSSAARRPNIRGPGYGQDDEATRFEPLHAISEQAAQISHSISGAIGGSGQLPAPSFSPQTLGQQEAQPSASMSGKPPSGMMMGAMPAIQPPMPGGPPRNVVIGAAMPAIQPPMPGGPPPFVAGQQPPGVTTQQGAGISISGSPPGVSLNRSLPALAAGGPPPGASFGQTSSPVASALPHMAMGTVAAPLKSDTSAPVTWIHKLRQQWSEISLPKKLIAILLPVAMLLFLVESFISDPEAPSASPVASSAADSKAGTKQPIVPQGGQNAAQEQGVKPPAVAANNDTASGADTSTAAVPSVAAGSNSGNAAKQDAGEPPKLAEGEITLQRQAADAVNAGDVSLALKLYEKLIQQEPDNQAYKDTLRIIKAKRK